MSNINDQNEDNTDWNKSRAKAALIKAIRCGIVPLNSREMNNAGKRMSLREIYDTVEGCSNFDYDKFSRRLGALRKKLMEFEEPEEPTTKWARSRAKDNIVKALFDGSITADTPLDEVYEIEEVGNYKRSKLEARFKSIVDTVAKSTSRRNKDKAAFDDFASRSVPSLVSHLGYIQWQGSDAQACLLEDIANNKHEGISKKELWLSNPEYFQNFPLDVFRDKFWQEIRTKKYSHTLKVKGKKKVADWN